MALEKTMEPPSCRHSPSPWPKQDTKEDSMFPSACIEYFDELKVTLKYLADPKLDEFRLKIVRISFVS